MQQMIASGVRKIIRRAPFLISVALVPGMAFSDDLSSPCVDALEQIATLKIWVPVYKQLSEGQRDYLFRPARRARAN